MSLHFPLFLTEHKSIERQQHLRQVQISNGDIITHQILLTIQVVIQHIQHSFEVSSEVVMLGLLH